MVPKRIGFLGFEGVTASHLAGPADTFAAAALEDGYGNSISCYQICTLGLASEPFRAESGMIVIPGGKGLRDSEVTERISDWILTRAKRTRRVAAIGTGIYGLAPTGLLDGRQVTTHWRFASDVAQRFPNLRMGHKR